MMEPLSRAWGALPGSARIRSRPEDFFVSEDLGFELSGDGEHAFLHLEKRNLNTLDLVQRVARLGGVQRRDVGYSGLKDRNAVTQQWLSVGLAGREDPQWQALEQQGDIRVLAVSRHRRKLRRGIHRANRFKLLLRDLVGDRQAVAQRLELIKDQGAPNYFGEQRFGRRGSTLEQALNWMSGNARVRRAQRGLYLSALRSWLYNQLLSQRVAVGDWNAVQPLDVCLLAGSRSWFVCDTVDEDIEQRSSSGDISPGVPLWGRHNDEQEVGAWLERQSTVPQATEIRDFLERSGSDLAWRSARLLPHDFCWRFCDDGSLQLDFALGAGCYATALLAECVHYKEGRVESGSGSEQV